MDEGRRQTETLTVAQRQGGGEPGGPMTELEVVDGGGDRVGLMESAGTSWRRALAVMFSRTVSSG